MRSVRIVVAVVFCMLGSLFSGSAQSIADIPEVPLIRDEVPDEPAGLIQGSTYRFSALSGVAFEDMSSGTTQLIGPGANDDNSAIADIGFLFFFDSSRFTTFGVNANGLLRLGPPPAAANNVNVITSEIDSPKIAPFWDDLCVGSGGKVHYKTILSGGNHKLIVEWSNMKVSRGTGCDGSGGGTFQLWLFERTGVIQFVYGNGMGPVAASDGGYTVGIANNLGMSGNVAAVNTATNTADYFAGPNVNSQMTTIAPGTSYLFRPNIPAAPSGGYATVTLTTAALNWTDNATNETSYLVRRTIDNINFDFVSQPQLNSVTYTDTGLSPSTQYFYYVSALSEGGWSDDLVIPVMTDSTASTITSTPTGGNWSSPSTWTGGTVPTGADDVVIAPGATVVIDTSAQAANVTVGTGSSRTVLKGAATEGVSTARLTFQETEARMLTVLNQLTIEANGNFSTGSGTINGHTIILFGNVTNNGTLDLSTNGGSAAASINFKGDSNATFGGTGPVTDIYQILVNKGATGNIVELTVSNFTAGGSTTDGPGSAYLFPTVGIFKISGTFAGDHRTFAAGNELLWSAGFWLNNPNYKVTARPASIINRGTTRLTAGEINAGVATNQGFLSGSLRMEGGRLNVSGTAIFGGMVITGGKITICRAAGGPSICNGSLTIPSGTPAALSGGEIVVQNSGIFSIRGGTLADLPNIAGTVLRFGNELTSGSGVFRLENSDVGAETFAPNVVLDTSSGVPHVLSTDIYPVHVMNLNIQGGGVFRFSNLLLHGNSIINNGQLAMDENFYSGKLEFNDTTGLTDITYSGNGSLLGKVIDLNIRGRSFTFDQALESITTYNLKVTNARIVNAGRITLGRHDSTLTHVQIYDGASLDAAPVFDLGPNGQTLTYGGTNTTGPEVNPFRYVGGLNVTGPGTLTMQGGDMSTDRLTFREGGILKTGPLVMVAINVTSFVPNGYVDGNLKIVPGTPPSLFAVGQNGYSPVSIRLTGTGALIVRSVDATLPGLDPTVSASRYWEFTEEGNLQGQITFTPNPADINGNPANYVKWRSDDGGTPVQVTTPVVDQLTGRWGLGQRLAPPPVSLSGTVTTSTGQPIRNAVLTISGGGLPAPVQTSTGNFGTYVFFDIPPNQTYTVQVSAKRYRFTPSSQVVTTNNDTANVNFTANPPE